MVRHRRKAWLGLAGAFVLLGGGCGDDVPGAAGARLQVEQDQDQDQDELDADEEWVENSLPEIEWVRLEPVSPAPGGSVTAQVRANDADGDELELGYAWRINGRPVRNSDATLQLANTMKGDAISVTVTVSDGWDEGDSETATAVIGNTPPLLQSVAIDPLGQITRGQNVSARPIAQDLDGDPLDYEFKWWVNGRELSNTTDMLDTSRLKRGDQVEIQVVATDGFSRSNAVKSAPILVANSPPKILSTPANAGDSDVYRYQVRAEDPDGDRRLRYRLEQGPNGMTIDPITGALSWTPPPSATGTQNVEVVVDDLQGGEASQRFTVVIGEEEAAKPAAAAAGTADADEAPDAAEGPDSEVAEAPDSDGDSAGPASADDDR